MAGVTDAPFRVVCAEQAARAGRHTAARTLFVSEMVTARGLAEGNPKSWAIIRHHTREAGRSLQLYGADPATMREAVSQLVSGAHVDHVDLNFGCPVPKVTRTGGGAALPAKRRLLAAVVRAAVEAAGSVPVTVKMRMGLDDGRLTYLEAGRVAESEGAAAVALHARTAAQGYDGTARWDAIARLRDRLQEVAVLGNGDIWAASDATAMMRATGCDGVVVGRGCLGRPWLFADLGRVIAGAALLGPPPLGETVAIVRRHLALALDWYGEHASTIRRFRKHLRWYLQGYPVGRDAHRAAGTVASVADVTGLLDRLDPALEVVGEAVRAPRGRQGRITRIVLPEGWCDDPDADVAVGESLTAVSGG
jgi:nifR3 family TIM-barrel protein